MFHKSFRLLSTRVVLAFLISLFCVLSFGLLPNAIAHGKNQSYLYFQIGQDWLSARAEIPISDLNDVLNLGLPTNQKLNQSDIEPHFKEIQSYIEQNLEIKCEPQKCQPIYKNYKLFYLSVNSQFLLVNYAIEGFDNLPETLQVTYDVILADNAKYTNMLLIENNWNTGNFNNEASPLFIYRKSNQSHVIDLSSGSLLQGFIGLMKLGIDHMIMGLDHVLFLVALLLPSVLQRKEEGWQPVTKFSIAFIHILKIVIAFTIAHSITLVLGTLQIVQLPSRLVESIIAISIGLVALEIFYPIFKQRAWLIIFVFGLFHGFGFAEILTNIGVKNHYAFLSLLCFNLGIVIGQIIIVAIVFPLLYFIRKQLFYRQLLIKGGAILLCLASLFWLIERAFDINIPIKLLLARLG